MKQNLLTFAFLAFAFSNAQNLSTLESFNLPQDTFLNGSDLNGGFLDESIFLVNNYNTDFNSWIGFSISSITDNTTPGYNNQYSCISGKGVNNSTTYATAYVSGESIIRLENGANTIDGLYVNNATYTYLSMRDGDAFAKKFGGASGDDKDYLKLTVKKYLNGSISNEEVEFYLADYSFDDNSQDYIINEWTYVDLTSLGEADSLAFTLSSTDNGQFGMNTPAYFCIDDIQANITSSLSNTLADEVKLYPNPILNDFFIEQNEQKIDFLRLYDVNGCLVKQFDVTLQSNKYNMSGIKPGIYFAKFIDNEGNYFFKQLVKE